MQASINGLKASRLVASRFVDALKAPLAFCSGRDRASTIALEARRLREMGLDAYLAECVYDSDIGDWDVERLADAMEFAREAQTKNLI